VKGMVWHLVLGDVIECILQGPVGDGVALSQSTSAIILLFDVFNIKQIREMKKIS
jgi:hypothetical protein